VSEQRLAHGAPDPRAGIGKVEQPAPQAEVHAHIGNDRPREGGAGTERAAAARDELDRQDQRQQGGRAEQEAVVKRERAQPFVIGVGLPQIDLRQRFCAQFGRKGRHRPGVERQAENVGIPLAAALGAKAGARHDVDDAREPEVGPQHARADDPVMRHDEQALDQLVAFVAEGEHRPVAARLARTHLHGTHRACRVGRGGDAGRSGRAGRHVLQRDRLGQVDRRRIGAHGHGVERPHRRRHGCGAQQDAHHNSGADDPHPGLPSSGH
jgi:hypothetical protein